MLYSNNFKVNSKELFKLFDENQIFNFKDFELNKISSIELPSDNSIFFIKKINEVNILLLNKVKNSIFFLQEYKEDINNIIVKTSNPRLDFIKFIEHINNHFEDDFSKGDFKTRASNIIISEKTEIDEGVNIFPNVYIGPNTKIGKNTIIFPNVSIMGNVIIGSNCRIGPNSVIGNHGFGGERGENGEIYMMPHLGGVEIENNVVIGANNTIVAGTINPTRIGESTKFDDHVHFAHNCIAGKSCFITACTQFSGSIVLGDRVWIGPNSSLFQGIQIGDDAIVGIGAVVLKDVLEGEIIIGNPGKPLLKK